LIGGSVLSIRGQTIEGRGQVQGRKAASQKKIAQSMEGKKKNRMMEKWGRPTGLKRHKSSLPTKGSNSLKQVCTRGRRGPRGFNKDGRKLQNFLASLKGSEHWQ